MIAPDLILDKIDVCGIVLIIMSDEKCCRLLDLWLSFDGAIVIFDGSMGIISVLWLVGC